MGLATLIQFSQFEQDCLEEKCFTLKNLREFNKATYKGFTLRKGYRYGVTENNIPVATSNWQQGNFIFMYFFNQEEEKWYGLWLDLDEIEIVEEREGE